MGIKKLSPELKRIINSYVIAQEDPLERIEDLQIYLKKKNIATLKKSSLEKIIKSRMKKEEDDELTELETRLFTKREKPRKHKYGSAFCDNCHMYKDYEKECPYCGKIEFTL